jgi:hypothetical protein
MDMPALATRWRTAVDDMTATLRELPDDAARRRPAPGKWSVKEIIGHLVDSAANNHQRFVLAQLRDGLVFDGYEQDGWIAAQRYQDSAWPDLVTLWQSFNHHLIHVASDINPELLDKEQLEHNLYDVASNGIPAGEPATLGYFIGDYVFHLEHHLKQVRALL